MKRFYYIIVIVSALFVASSATAQEATPQAKSPRTSRKSDAADASGVPALTVRAQNMNENMTQKIGNARWMRVIYRELDLEQEENAPLYYPVRPMNGNMNLFSIIFRLMSQGKLSAYEYLDGYEAFEDKYKIDFKEMMDRFHILYEEQPGKGSSKVHYAIDDSDVPSEEVRGYYVKEAWYFDQNNSVFDVKTLAICPILFSQNDLGENQRSPMFWVPYENIRPYVNTAFIMTSNINNAKTFTIDDYFRRRMFKGDIYKTENLMNRSLVQYCQTPDSLKKEQQRIESELAGFEKNLWIGPDTTSAFAAAGKEKKVATTSVRGQKATNEKAVKQAKTKTSQPKAQKSAPVRSVRRRR